MRLVLNNDFTWDGVYGINDELGDEQYVIIADIEDGVRNIRIFTREAYEDAQRIADEKKGGEVGVAVIGQNPVETVMLKSVANEYGVPVAEVIEKVGFNKAKYTLALHTRVIGSMTRQFKSSDDPYDVEVKDWFVSGDVGTWEYIIVDKHGKIADSGMSGDKMGLEYHNKSDKLKCAMMLTALAALSRDMKDSFAKAAAGESISRREPLGVPAYLRGDAEGSGLEDAIGMMRDSAEKIGKFFRK